MKLEDVIRSKGTSVVTIAPTATVAELVSLMADNNIGSVVVSRDGLHIDGIVNERDIVRGLASAGAGLIDKSVADLVPSDVVVGHLEDRLEDTAQTMTTKRVRHIPIEVNGELAAIVSIGDVVKFRMDQLTDERNHLMGYVQRQST